VRDDDDDDDIVVVDDVDEDDDDDDVSVVVVDGTSKVNDLFLFGLDGDTAAAEDD
jgi:hypothetical protein